MAYSYDWRTKDGNRIRRLRGAIRALVFDLANARKQLAAQRAIVAANDAYRSRLIDLRDAQSLDEVTGGDSAIMAAADVDEANRACRRTLEIAKLIDKEPKE
ncbi:hypothetical protein LCGC14_0249720 [marine sediment metagenome]|uniref:Uncharacterized protein n=1 Tax=marine sediment metagenome TaxID=412755 RepID=A0A0F9U9V5_9ZZZZ